MELIKRTNNDRGKRMSYKVDNAIIMAAGYSSRFAPISYEYPKALIKVKGEVLIERQIRQLQEAGVSNIIIVVGYKKEQFYYLKDKCNIQIVENNEYDKRNNNSTINAVKDYLGNSYICSADNYFMENPFEKEVDEAYYSALYAKGTTNEWCLRTDENDYITEVVIGGADSWYMLGHVFWTKEFSQRFVEILDEIYDLDETKDKLWEAIYMEHLHELKLKMRCYEDSQIYEFDSLDELREFDETYKYESGSYIMKNIANELNCNEGEIVNILPTKKGSGDVGGFSFVVRDRFYKYDYESCSINE